MNFFNLDLVLVRKYINMDVYQLSQLLNRAANEANFNEADGHHELFIRVANNEYLILGLTHRIGWNGLSVELLQDYLEFLSLFPSGIQGYEMVCQNVFRVWIRKSSKVSTQEHFSKAS